MNICHKKGFIINTLTLHKVLRASNGALLGLSLLIAGDQITHESAPARAQPAEAIGEIATAGCRPAINCGSTSPLPLEGPPIIPTATTTSTSNARPGVLETNFPSSSSTTPSTLVRPAAKPKAQPPATPRPYTTHTNFQTAPPSEQELQYLKCIAYYESRGSTTAYNKAGPYYGKYQFYQGTWDRFVVSIGKQSLLQVDIRQVSEPVQDNVALQFLRAGRRTEWGTNKRCSQHLN